MCFILTCSVLPLLVNLSGNCRRNILDHKLQLSCSRYLPPTSELLPTGEILSVQNSNFDFLSSVCNGKVLGDAVPLIDGGGRPGLDHCFVVDGYADAGGGRAGAEHTLHHVATLTDEVSGRQVVCHSSMPAVQVYTANWLPSEGDAEGQGQHPHVQHNAVCLETQHFPDSPNQPSFPSTVLRPGEKYRHRSVFSFQTVE
jgi:aldose 1-epimerase